jgi:hypothetical protein
MFLLSSDWPHYHCHLGVLLLISTSTSQLWHPPARLPTLPLTFSVCGLDPLGFEDPPPGFPVAERTRHCLDMLAAMACFRRSTYSAISSDSFPASCTCLFHSLHYRHRSYLTQYGWSTWFCHLGPPDVSPRLPPRSRVSCCSPQDLCVSGAPEQVSDDEVHIPCLHVTSPPRPSALATSPAVSDGEFPIPFLTPTGFGFMVWWC